MNIPTPRQCDALIREMEMLDHIVAHSMLVRRVALLITDRLNAAGSGLHRELVRASATLHDITKTRSFATRENHAETGEAVLRELGYPEVGEVVGQHVRLNDFYPNGPCTEAEVVNYADKRVLHDQVATLDDRMAYILNRYGGSPGRRDRIRLMWREAEGIEAKLFQCIPFSPDDLAGRLVNREGRGF